MKTDPDVTSHYALRGLLERLNAALSEDGVDPGRPSFETLAPYDHFHGRGLEATVELGGLVVATATDHVLDVGSGIGGPARYFARHFGCRVTGIDLTPEFCDVARHLSRLLDMDERVRFEVGNALHMPFAESSFDGAYSMNVSMNIDDKGAFYREIHRVLRPGAWLALSEVARGEGADPDYPTPWAASAGASFLSTPDESRRSMAEAGFDVVVLRSTRDAALEFAARARAMVERGGKPPQRAVTLIHGEAAPRIIANASRALGEGRVVPIEVLARKRR